MALLWKYPYSKIILLISLIASDRPCCFSVSELKKRDQLLVLKCALAERDLIRTKANNAHLSISEYLRELGLTGKIDMRKKALPGEVLFLTALLNHMAANLNQIARKRNSNDELTVLERADLKTQSMRLKELSGQIKNHFL